MAEPQQLPCDPWTTADKLCCPDLADIGGPCDDVPVPATYVWNDAALIRMASKILFERTCRRFPGICEDLSLRPCDPCKNCRGCCECRYEFVPIVGAYPVTEIVEVKVDGVAVPPGSYRVDEYIRLVRTDGQLWPRWQNLNADPDLTTDRTFVVRYKAGRSVPEDLQYAAALLACELKRACNGQGCRLPDRVKSVVRDGVSYEILDSAEVAFNGSFGVPMIDAILATYPCGEGATKRQMTTRLFHPLMDGERYDRSGVR